MASGGTSKPPANGGVAETWKLRKVSIPGGVVPVSCNANECLKLHIVLGGHELQTDDGDDYTCDPEFAERIFGEDGKIYGYRGLKIDLWLHAATFHAYVQIQYTSKSAGGKKTPCTDVLAKLKEVFGDGLTEDRNAFQQSLLAYASDFQQLLEKHAEVVFSWRSPVKEENDNADSSIETPDKLIEENTNADSNSGTLGKIKEANIDADSNMEENTNADSNNETAGKLKEEIINADSNMEEHANADGNVEEITNTDGSSDTPGKLREENTIADGNSEIAEKLTQENANADSNMEENINADSTVEEVINADGNSETLEQLTEENVNADSNMEENINADSTVEEVINADGNSETLEQLTEENVNADSNMEENTNADSNVEEVTNADGNSETLEKLTEEIANADSNMQENTNADSNVEEITNADGNSETLEKLTEENANSVSNMEETTLADINIELPDKQKEEATHVDSNTELLDEQKEENTHDDSNSETLEKSKEENSTAYINSESQDKLKEENSAADINSEPQDKLNEENSKADIISESHDKLKEETSNGDTSSERQDKLKQIVRVELGDPAVRAWHARLTPLSLLFIEGAQPIESDDPLWEVYLALEREGLQTRVAGFCNVYRFYHYPDSTRLRISQILVLPPYQGDGFGLQLLQAVNTAATTRSCYDVTMEDPSFVLRKVRDTMDVLRLLSLPTVEETLKDALGKLQVKRELALSTNGSGVSGDQSGALVKFNGNDIDAPLRSRPGKEKSPLAPPAHLVEEIRKKFKISKMQFRRCWEQLLFMFLDPRDRDLQDVFREALVQRLNLEIFEKDTGKKSGGKRVFDTDNQYDNSKTFVMMKRRKIDAIDGDGNRDEEADVAGDEVEALVPGPEEKARVLQEELKEREDELVDVARTVARHCTTLGLNFPSMKIWETVPQDAKEQAT